MTYDYFNPNSMNPGNGWKPDGFLGGMLYGQDRSRYESMMNLQAQMEQERLAQQRMQTETYRNTDYASSQARGGQMTSEAQLAGQMANTRRNNPNYAPSIVEGDIGKAQEQSAAGKLAQGTVAGKIDVQNAKSRIQQWDVAADMLQRSGATSPMMAQGQWQQIKQTLPKEVQGMFPDAYDPSVPGRIKEFVKAADTHISNHVRELEKTRAGHETAIPVAQIHGAAQVEAARVRAQARIKTLLENFTAAKTESQMMMYGEMIKADPEVEPAVIKQVEAGMAMAKKIFAERQAKGGIDFKDPTGGQAPLVQGILDRLNSDTQSPYGGKMNIPGAGEVTVIGKNPDGSIRFKAANGRTGTYRPNK